MYDPRFYPSDLPYSELDDPSFWAAIASQVDTTALLHPEERQIQVTKSPSNSQQSYQYPTTERLWLPAPRNTKPIVSVHSEIEAEETETSTTTRMSGTTGQEGRVTSQYSPAKTQQRVWLPILLIGLAAMMLLAVMSTPLKTNSQFKGTSSTFNDSTPEVPGTWNMHCHQSTPPGAGGTNAIVGSPTVDADFINKVLSYYGSPMEGQGQTFVDVSRYCGLDPAFVLAFYMHESSFGLAGEARYSLSPGNLRCIPGFKCQDGYAWFGSWQDGLMVQCRLLRNLYVDAWGLTTPEQIIPRYAPTADNNNEQAYEYALEHAVGTWRHHIIAVP